MAKEKEKTVDVKIGDRVEKVVVRRPGNTVMNQAQKVGAKVWTECVRDGIMTKKELENFMKDQGIWNEGKDLEQEKIVKKISSLEKELYFGGKTGKMKASKGKEIAINMRRERIKLRNLLAQKLGLEQNTAEALSENAKFDFLVASCTFREDGATKVYANMEEYNAKADEEIAFEAATALAALTYSVDKDFEEKLPENQFLKRFKFVDEDLSLVNTDGETVDTDGKRIDDSGYYLNEDGLRTDQDGNHLDENGNFVPTVVYLDDNGKPIKIEEDEEVTEAPEPEDKTER